MTASPSIQQVHRDRRITYQNRVETNRRDLILSVIEKEHHREQTIHRKQRLRILTDMQRKNVVLDTSLALIPAYQSIDFRKTKGFYPFDTRVHSSVSHVRSPASQIHSYSSRSRSTPISLRPYTASFPRSHRTFSGHKNTESNTRLGSTTISSIASKQRSVSAVVTSRSNIQSADHRAFPLQDEDDPCVQFSTCHHQQRKIKTPYSFIQCSDRQLEQRKETEAFVIPKLSEEHQIDDPVFARRYRQFKLAIRANQIPIYDPADNAINTIISRTKLERARTALIAVGQSRRQDLYRDQQRMSHACLSHRIDNFLERLAKFQEEQSH